MKLSTLKVLSDSEIRELHSATMDILTQCGVKILNVRMLDFLEKKGLEVNRDTQIVRFTRSCLENALSTIPSTIELYNQNGVSAFTLGDGKTKVAAGHNAVFWLDGDTGQTRPSTVADVELFARICDHLETIDMIGIPVMPQDVPHPKASLLYGVRACVENSTKPIFFSTDSDRVNHACIDILRTVFKGDLNRQPYGISQLSPTSPLFWESSVIDAIMDTVAQGVPLAILPEPNAGISCPYTLAGLLTMNNAECLSGLAISQMLRPKAPVIYANSWTATDMQTGAALVGSTEMTLCRIAGAQLGQFYKVPTHTTSPNSDNHAHDEQNAWEKTFSQFCAIVAGNDLVVNCGMFATGMTCSHEQLLMDEEISAITRRIAKGIEVTPETIAAELIRRVGPQGETYLTQDHTLQWLRSGEYLKPRLAVRGPFASWNTKGAKTTDQLAHAQVQAYAQQPKPSFADEHGQKLDDILSSFTSKTN